MKTSTGPRSGRDAVSRSEPVEATAGLRRRLTEAESWRGRRRSWQPDDGTRIPAGVHARREMYPYTLDELRQAAAELVVIHPEGDLVTFSGLLG